MRSFIASVILIAGVLIGQQLVTRSSEAQGIGVPPVAHAALPADAYARWLAPTR